MIRELADQEARLATVGRLQSLDLVAACLKCCHSHYCSTVLLEYFAGKTFANEPNQQKI